MRTALSLAFLVTSFASPSSSGGSDWSQFRGPNGTGAVPKAAIPLAWSEKEHLAWKTEIPGQGWSQPVVAGGMVYVTSAVGDGLESPMGMADGAADPHA